MMKFYCVANEKKDPGLEIAKRIQQYLIQAGASCECGTQKNDGNGFYTDPSQIPEGTDICIVLGGDGTLLDVSRATTVRDIPILGINMGTMGYLAQVEVEGIEHALDRVLAGDYRLEERMMLDGTYEGEVVQALNDITITRNGTLRMVPFNLYVNGQLLRFLRADGIIISTPTGSTAYNMSAGGPIVEPSAKMMVITPICPHTLNLRSIVLSADDVIEIEAMKLRCQVNAFFDGSRGVELAEGKRISIRKSQQTLKLIQLSDISFLDLLQNKMK